MCAGIGGQVEREKKKKKKPSNNKNTHRQADTKPEKAKEKHSIRGPSRFSYTFTQVDFFLFSSLSTWPAGMHAAAHTGLKSESSDAGRSLSRCRNDSRTPRSGGIAV